MGVYRNPDGSYGGRPTSNQSILRDDLLRLAKAPESAAKPLDAARTVGAIPAQSHAVEQSRPVDAGSIASPLTEPDYATRQFHPEEILTSQDGVFTFRIRRLKQVDMLDANGNPVVFKYDTP